MVLDREVRTPTVGAPVRGRCVTALFCFPVDLQMAGRPNPFPMGVSDPFLAGYVIWFGSLEFRATGNGYLMERLPPRVSSDVPAPPPQH